MQPQPALLARQALLGEARRLARRVRELLVASAARAAARDHDALTRPDEVVDVAALLRGHHGARRDADLERLPRRPVAQRALAVTPAARLVVRLALVGLQVAQRRIADEHDVAAASAVAPVGTAPRHVGLAPEAHRPVAPAAPRFGATRGFLEETPEQWPDIVLTNALGAAYTTRATLPALRETAEQGHVLLTSSVAARRVLPGSLYGATKHAVTAMA